MVARRPYKGPVLTGHNHSNHLAQANNYVGRTRQQWWEVLYKDESKFSLSFSDVNKRIYKRKGERFAQCYVLEHITDGARVEARETAYNTLEVVHPQLEYTAPIWDPHKKQKIYSS